MTGARQTIAVIITFRKSNKDSLEHGSCAPNFVFFFYLTSISVLWRICVCVCVCVYIYTHTHTHITDCVKIEYELRLLPNNTASEIFLNKVRAV